MTQRRLNSAYSDKVGRDGRVPKNIATENVPIKPGMKRQTTGDLHPYLHGQSVDDEPLQKTYEGKSLPINPATPSKPQRGQHVEGLGAALLDQASRLGRPPEKAR